MADFIGLDVRGLKQIKEKLDKLPPEAQDAVTDEVSGFLLDVLRAYPPKKRVTRKKAYGVTFFSDKQRRFFFWALDKGKIKVPYKRTQTLRKGWKLIGKGASSILANETPYGHFLMDDDRQSRHAFLIGWPILSEVVQDHEEQIVRHADGAIKRAMKKVGLVEKV